ncbi:MAG: DUF2786 domain-containing protein [Azospirillaceae bacterium]|nr:DUF2786 domain-containing protein [Azospirillaceae bacterium]
MADLRAIRDKIRALRAKTVKNGCTEAEAAAAAELAMRLMSTHGIDAEEVEQPEFEEAEEALAARRSAVDNLWPYVAMVCGCTLYLTGTGDRRRVVYFGLAPNPEIAAYVHDVCHGAVRRAVADFRQTPEYKRKRLARTRNELVRAFTEALVQRVGSRLVDMRFGIGWGDLKKLSRQAKQELDLRHTDLRTLPPIKTASQGARLGNARLAGAMAGNAVDINMGVAGQKDVKRLGGANHG